MLIYSNYSRDQLYLVLWWYCHSTLQYNRLLKVTNKPVIVLKREVIFINFLSLTCVCQVSIVIVFYGVIA